MTGTPIISDKPEFECDDCDLICKPNHIGFFPCDASKVARHTSPTPCPFCECKNTLMQDDGGEGTNRMHWVRCVACQARGPILLSEPMAIQAWNAGRKGKS